MKEKEVDAYLSLASLCHLLVLGAGGTFVSEVFAEGASFEIKYLSGFLTILAWIASMIFMPRYLQS